MKHVKLFEQFIKPQTLNEGKVSTGTIIKRIENDWELADSIIEITEEELNTKITVNFNVRMPSLERVKLTIKTPRIEDSAQDRMNREDQLRQIVESEGGIPVSVARQITGGGESWTVQFITPEGFENSELLKDKDKLDLVANMIRDRLDVRQQKKSSDTKIARWLKKDAKVNPDYNHMENLAEATSLYLTYIRG